RLEADSTDGRSIVSVVAPLMLILASGKRIKQQSETGELPRAGRWTRAPHPADPRGLDGSPGGLTLARINALVTGAKAERRPEEGKCRF
ncbi:MAG: hypothetical protein ACRECE_01035, partial [Xanthobacteraceae bacterium]